MKFADVTEYLTSANTAVEDDAQVKLLLEATTPVVTIFGKTWLLHVTDVLRTTPEENLTMIDFLDHLATYILFLHYRTPIHLVKIL